MSTFHEDMAEQFVGRLMESPEYAAGVARANRDRRHGKIFMDPEAFDVIGQGPRLDLETCSLAQLAVTLDIHAHVHLGTYAHFRVPIGYGPSADVQREKNAAKLSNVTEPFRILLDLDQHCADQDGWLRWTEPVRAGHSFGASFLPPCKGDKPDSLHGPIQLEPLSVPLEVGSTLPSRTFAHLKQDGGVARWPYGHDSITVLVALDRKQWPRAAFRNEDEFEAARKSPSLSEGARRLEEFFSLVAPAEE